MLKPAKHSPKPEVLSEKLSHLLALRKRMDNKALLSDTPFEYLQNRAAAVLGGKNNDIGTTNRLLDALMNYVRQFEIFRLTTLRFFEQTQKYDGKMLHRSPHYEAVKSLSEQMFDDFKFGKYWRGNGMNLANDMLQAQIKAFEAQLVDMDKKEPPKSETQAAAQVPPKPSASSVSPNFGSDLSKERYMTVKAAYLKLQLQLLSDLLLKKEHKFTKTLPELRKALLHKDAGLLENALRKIENSIAPTLLHGINDGATAQRKVMDVNGTSEPNTTVALQINDSSKLTASVNEKGNFAFEDIVLRFGDNFLKLYNEDFMFLNENIAPMCLYLEPYYPFLGLYDPLTQKAFEPAEAEAILRCKKCGNYMYHFSMEENAGLCVMPNCDGKLFNNERESGFWK